MYTYSLGTHQLPVPALYIKSSYWILVNANHFLPPQFILLMCMWPLLPASVNAANRAQKRMDKWAGREGLIFFDAAVNFLFCVAVIFARVRYRKSDPLYPYYRYLQPGLDVFFFIFFTEKRVI